MCERGLLLSKHTQVSFVRQRLGGNGTDPPGNASVAARPSRHLLPAANLRECRSVKDGDSPETCLAGGCLEGGDSKAIFNRLVPLASSAPPFFDPKLHPPLVGSDLAGDHFQQLDRTPPQRGQHFRQIQNWHFKCGGETIPIYSVLFSFVRLFLFAERRG